jgi:hypothetical protein
MRKAHHANEYWRKLHEVDLIVFCKFPKNIDQKEPAKISNPNHPYEVELACNFDHGKTN